MKSFKEGLQNIFNFFDPVSSLWRGATLGISSLLMILWTLTAYHVIPDRHPWKAILLYFLCGLLYILLVSAILYVVLRLIRLIPLPYLIAIGCFWFTISVIIFPLDTWAGMLLIYLPLLLFSSLLGGAAYSLLKTNFATRTPWKKRLLILSLAIGFIGLGGMAFWLISQRQTFSLPRNFPEWKIDPNLQIPLANPSLPGPYEVQTLTYGSGNERHRPEYAQNANLVTPAVDGSAFITGWDGLDGILRTWYWGFDPTQLPLNARVWFPDGKGPFPLILLVHGNHEMMAFSEDGYAYLGNLFASHGMIAASIDENFFNNSWFEWEGVDAAAARGWLILEHLKRWRQWNSEKGNPFYGKVDMQHIGLLGHSRGGEAIAVAAALNPLKHYPNDGTMLFDYGFNIVALAAIAPVDGQFKPAGLPIRLENVDYFIMHGSHDGDIRSFQGLEQYQRIKFTDPDFHFKTALYIFGANHGQFNDNWGLQDASYPSATLYELGGIISKNEQQKIAEVYLSAFFEAALKGETDYLPLFRDYRSGASWLPRTEYVNQYEDSTMLTLISSDKELDVTKTSVAGGKIQGESLTIWRKGTVPLKQPGRSLEAATFVGWDKCDSEEVATYTIDLPPNNFTLDPQSILILSLADADHDKESNLCAPIDQAVDFTIELTDKNEEAAQLPLSFFAPLPPPIHVDVMKIALLDSIEGSEIVYKTFEFPLHEFVKQNSKFDPTKLKQIRLLFDRTKEGLIVIDKIGFRSDKLISPPH